MSLLVNNKKLETNFFYKLLFNLQSGMWNASSVHSLPVLTKEVQSLLNLCRPNETSSLEKVLRAPAGPLIAADDRPAVENFTPDVLLTFSEPLQPQNNEES